MIFTNRFLQTILINILGIGLAYFIYKQSSLYQEQIRIYLIVRFLLINLIFIKNKFIKILSIPPIIGIGFFLILGFLPLYNQTPDGSNFYLSQKIEYQFIGNPKNVEINEISEYGEQKIIPTQKQQTLFFIESYLRTIILNEKIDAPKENNKLIIKFPDNTIYIAYPGSKISIKKDNNIYTIDKEYGKIEYYKPKNNSQTKIINTENNEQKNKSDFILPYIIDEYENSKIKYIINEAGGDIILHPVYQRFSKKILDIAYNIRPNIYIKNLENFEQYKQLLGLEQTTSNYEKENNWRNLILQQIQKGRKETRFLQQN